MANYRRVARRPVVVVEMPKWSDANTKAELTDAAAARGLDTSGNKADLIKRLNR